jgi:hypothetical protein
MMWSMRRLALHRIAPVVLCGLAVTGCDEPFSPYWDRGTYFLRYANNRPVPAVVSSGPASSYTEVLTGSLTLRRNHSYQLLVDVREVVGGRVFETTRVFAGSYDHDGYTLWLSYVPPGDYYSAVMVANWRSGRLEVVVPGVDGPYGVLCMFED